MRKLTLDLDVLQVESFTTDRPAPGQGTVRGHGLNTESCEVNCTVYTFEDRNTCGPRASCMTICIETEACEPSEFDPYSG